MNNFVHYSAEEGRHLIKIDWDGDFYIGEEGIFQFDGIGYDLDHSWDVFYGLTTQLFYNPDFVTAVETALRKKKFLAELDLVLR